MDVQDIASDVANDDEKLIKLASEQIGSGESSFEVDSWTNYYADIVGKHTTARLVVFKAPALSDKLRCIRVRDKDDMNKTV
ncbi:hypothetical protein K505DRAFT_329514 [Melanomma pulvis-pyrius CBS 109.77]|uniref:Uncharacterized protein n=1 Tax=Melanomma pulvis-pyrius CBS 109.77 TaxID=1314802 RepID=A0A6A6WUS3_9PLEO|nr:hypothetical protein K505DRAFT_329514 [Melanomma pulvis-pyrius CBS 109.77]